MENPQHIKQLYEKYLNNDFSEQELDELLEYFYSSGEHHELSEMIRAELASEESEHQSHPAVQALLAELDRDLFAEIEKRRTPVKTVRLWPRIAVAAAAVAAIVVGVYFFNASRPADAPHHPELVSGSQDIAPGKNGATITLANGKVIKLSDAKTGVMVGNDLTYDDGSEVVGGRHPEFISGSRNSKGGGPDLMQMTASTARGQTYQFTLTDGTKVWLNADSKLEFPSKFVNSKTRIVKLLGEGYFEVAKDKAHPFIVQTDEQQVEVLGTHFNINSYADEGSVKTTLLEGSVRVNDVVLKPNQQSVLTGTNRIQVKDVDVSEAVAWKNGLFSFNNAPMQTVMRQIARWYNVEVEYESEDLKNKLLDGSVSRYDQVSGILNAITQTGAARFKIEGKKIKVIK